MEKKTIREFLEEATKNYAEKKAQLIDRELFKFLREQGVTESTDLNKIKKALLDKRLQVVMEYGTSATQEIYTYRLCRVFAETSINIPKPDFNLED